jgi:hypothetical protein
MLDLLLAIISDRLHRAIQMGKQFGLLFRTGPGHRTKHPDGNLNYYRCQKFSDQMGESCITHIR